MSQETLMDALRGLVTQWQKEAAHLRGEDGAKAWNPIRANGMIDCITQLSSILAGVPKPPTKDDDLTRMDGRTPIDTPQPAPTDCAHEQFRSQVNIQRLIDSGKFLAEVTIHCTGCGSPFRFIGVDAGLAWDRPVASIDALELRAPIEPEGEPRLLLSATFQMPEIPKRH